MKNNIILFQGDSITDCGRARDTEEPNIGLGAGYPALIAARLLCDRAQDDFTFFNRGISGNRVVDLYARWKSEAVNLTPGLISILIGVNDTWHERARRNGVGLERYEMIYRMMLEYTRRRLPEIKLVLMEPFVFPVVAADETWVEEIRLRGLIVSRLAEEFQAVFVPLQAKLDAAAAAKNPTYYLRDGVHPTYAGHQLIADAWIEAVRDAKFI